MVNSRSNLAVITLGLNFERAGIFPIFFSNTVTRTRPIAFAIAATLVVVAVAYFDINAKFGARL